MSKTEKKIPELRFPEFAKSAEWEEKTLEEVGKTISGLSGKSAEDFGSGKPYVTYKQVFDNAWVDFSKCGFVQINDNENQNKVQEGDILFTTSSETPNEVGFASAVLEQPKEDTYLNSFCFAIRPNDLKNLQPEFSRYLFHSFTYRKAVSVLAQGSTRFNISKSSFLNLKISIPKLKEQQKIASCLSSLDEVIAIYSQKLEQLKDHKTGLLQNLFPAQGEKIPKVRFKGFKGAWEERFVEDFFSVGSSKRVLQEDWTNQGVPFYRTRELVSLNKNEPFGSEIFISEELFLELSERYGVPKEGDFLVSGVGTLGVCYQVQANDKFYFKDGNVLWFKLESGLNSTYFKFCFQSDYIQSQIFKQASASTVGTYTIQNAKKTTVWCPPTLEEQQKIASCLSSLDELITVQAEKIEQLELHKKGLMQGLFPKINN